MILSRANVIVLNSIEKEMKEVSEGKQRSYIMHTAAYRGMGLLRHKNDGLAQDDHRVAIRESCRQFMHQARRVNLSLEGQHDGASRVWVALASLCGDKRSSLLCAMQ